MDWIATLPPPLLLLLIGIVAVILLPTRSWWMVWEHLGTEVVKVILWAAAILIAAAYFRHH